MVGRKKLLMLLSSRLNFSLFFGERAFCQGLRQIDGTVKLEK